MLQRLHDKIYKIIDTEYFDYLVESFRFICPYAFDYMPINISDKKDKSFYYEIDKYLQKHDSDFFLSVDHLVYSWFDLLRSNDKDGDVIWADIVEDEKPNYFTKEELDVIYDNFYNTHLSLFEVININLGKNVIVKDLFTGEEYTVVEHMGSFNIQKYDCLMTRIIKCQGKNFFSFAVIRVPKFKQETIVSTIYEIYEEKKVEDMTLEIFLKVLPTFLTYTVYNASIEMQKIELVNTTGEEIKFCTVNYEILNYNELINQLDRIEEFDKIEENKKEKTVEYIWFGGTLNGKSSSAETNRILKVNKSYFVNGPTGNVSLGHLWIKNNELKAECNSEKRLKRLKEILNKIGKNLLKFKNQDMKAPGEVMYDDAPSLSENKVPKEEIPYDVKAQLMEEFYIDFYKKLFTEKIPALNNKSPKECLKTEEGRKLLYNLLKQYENAELHKKANGEYWFDINKIYEMWHLPRE